MRAITRALRFFPGDRLGFGGRQPFNMMLDWTHEALTGRYRVEGDPVDYDTLLAQLTVPVLMISLHGDRLVPRSSADYLARKLTRACVSQIELRAEDGKPYDHFRWMRKPTPVPAPVDHWISARFAGSQRVHPLIPQVC